VAVNQTLSRLRYLVEVGWQTFPPVARLQPDNRRYRLFPVVVAQFHYGDRFGFGDHFLTSQWGIFVGTFKNYKSHI